MKISSLIIFCFIAQTSQAQKDGYESIQIGRNFFDKIITGDYNLDYSSTDSLTFRLKGKLPKFICDEGVDYLDVQVDTDSTIKIINLYTLGKIYPDKNAFSNNYKKISECMVQDLGKPDYLNNGKNRQDGLMTAAWKFPDLKIIFLVYTYNLPVQINNVKRLFKMVWRVYDPKEPPTGW